MLLQSDLHFEACSASLAEEVVGLGGNTIANNDASFWLGRRRVALRRRIEVLKNDRIQLIGYIRPQQGIECLKGEIYLHMDQSWSEIIDEARRLDA